MRKLYWGTVRAQTDVGGLWIHAKVRPAWYWWLRRLHLFLGIVWRNYEGPGTRIDARTAWSVSHAAIGLTAPVPIHPMSETPKATGLPLFADGEPDRVPDATKKKADR